MASPNRPWFRMSTPLGIDQLDDEAMSWLHQLDEVTLDVLDRSNYYNATGQQIGDELRFANSPKIIFEDEEKVIRCQVFPAGSYVFGQNHKGVVDTFGRQYVMTVRQVVGQWGIERVSDYVRNLWLAPDGTERNRRLDDKVTIRHLIQPNEYADAERAKVDARYLPWKECYWEYAGGAAGSVSQPTAIAPNRWGGAGALPDDTLLAEGGYHEYPGSAARWDKLDDDHYGTTCPGREALGDVMQLMTMVRRRANAVAKMVDPPLRVSPSLDNEPVSLLAGARTSGEDGSVAPIHEVRISVKEVSELIAETVDDINQTYMTHIFLSMLGSQRTQPLTAEETRAIVHERNTVLGPILERHSDDVFDRDLERVTGIILRRSQAAWMAGEPGLVPPPPQSLQGMPLRVEYTSEFAQGQKLVSLQGVEQLLVMAANIEPLVPGAMDKLDTDAVIDQVAEILDVDPDLIRDDDELTGMRQARQQAAQAEQMASLAPAMAGAARDATEPGADGQSAVQRILGV